MKLSHFYFSCHDHGYVCYQKIYARTAKKAFDDVVRRIQERTGWNIYTTKIKRINRQVYLGTK